MADDQPSGAWGSSFVILAFAAVSAAYVAWQHTPLVSSRPTEPEYPAHELRSAQDIDARLWEDPFAAVTRDAKAKRWPETFAALMRVIETRSWRDSRAGCLHTKAGFDHPGENTLAIGVTLPGASYPEVAETRRRLRYAVLSALHVAGYSPIDEKHIGYWRPDCTVSNTSALKVNTEAVDGWPAATNAAATGIGFEGESGNGTAIPAARGAAQARADASLDKPPLLPIVPWEEFDKDKKHVLVIWLDEDFLTAGRQPISSLVELRLQLNLPLHSSNFALVGPEDSTMLAAMVGEINNRDSQAYMAGYKHRQAQQSLDTGISVYNFGATVEAGAITKDGNIAERLKDIGIQNYYRTINTDDELAKILACELMRRDPNLRLDNKCDGVSEPDRPRDHVVLLSDWDTSYGRHLSKTVAQTFGKQGQAIDFKWIRQVRYLRGLDGRLPNQRVLGQTTSPESGAEEKPAEQAAANQPRAATPETARSQFESPEGQSLFDYLRRLAADLKERDAKFRRTDGGHIAAVGVLGSDVYDKLLILQALRPELPEALFFTTDLDELLLPQKKTRYTRNLLVASSFGLRLDDKGQADILNFRSTYQTSIFLAVQVAIQNEIPHETGAASSEFDSGAVQTATAQLDPKRHETAPKPEAATSSFNLVGDPSLFQIGRTAPQILPTAAQTGSPVELRTRLAVFLVPLLPIGVLFSFARVRRVSFGAIGPAEQDEYTRWSRWMRAGLVSLVVLGLWARLTFGWASAALWLTGNGLGEPISVSEGVSIWPTIGLHAFGLVVSLFLISYALRSLEINRRDTWGEMGVTERPKTFSETFWEALSNFIFDGALKNGGAGLERNCDWFSEVANGYGANWKMRCIRAAAWTLLMMLLWYLVLVPIFDEPNVPARGHLAVKLYSWITIPDVIATLFLTFLVADATLHSRALIVRLNPITTIWPIATRTRFKKEFDLECDEDLTDWLDMQFLARRTRCITGLVYLPFIAFALLIVSRMQIFDDFSNPWTLTIAQAISMTVVIASVYFYRAAAEAARDTASENLSKRIVAATGANQDARASQLQMLMDDIKNLNEGAFAPWTRQPIVGAVLLPLITYGGTWLLHLYALPGI